MLMFLVIGYALVAWTKHLTIKNSLGPGKNLELHCKSKMMI